MCCSQANEYLPVVVVPFISANGHFLMKSDHVMMVILTESAMMKSAMTQVQHIEHDFSSF